MIPCLRVSKRFQRSLASKRHEGIHAGKKLYACSRCDKSLKRTGDLKRHEMTHTDEKPLANQAQKEEWTSQDRGFERSKPTTGGNPKPSPLVQRCERCRNAYGPRGLQCRKGKRQLQGCLSSTEGENWTKTAFRHHQNSFLFRGKIIFLFPPHIFPPMLF